MKTHILLSVAAALAACTTTPPNLDAQFGDSMRSVKARQTLNPNASADYRPVTALDGNAADAIVNRYRKTFETPPPPTNVFNIGVTSGGGGGGGGK